MLVEDPICSVVFVRNQQMTGAQSQVHYLWRRKAHQTSNKTQTACERQAQGQIQILFTTKEVLSQIKSQ